jgi:hypothetical protein
MDFVIFVVSNFFVSMSFRGTRRPIEPQTLSDEIMASEPSDASQLQLKEIPRLPVDILSSIVESVEVLRTPKSRTSSHFPQFRRNVPAGEQTRLGRIR